MEVEETSNLSEGSLAGLTARDIPIHSTSFHMKKKSSDSQITSADSKLTACTKKKVCISVKKLREVAPPHHPECSGPIHDNAVYIPPALLANRPTSQKPTAGSPEEVAEGALSKSTGRHSEQLLSPEKDGQPSQPSPEAATLDFAVPVPSHLKGDAGKEKAADIFISQFDPGQKDAVRAVFKQRIQSVPVFKEVKVQLLDNVQPDKKDSTKSALSEMDSAATIAAATAAAIASTAPLLKVQNELEAKVSSVSEILSKLQETDKHLQRVAEQQANMKAQQLEQLPCHQRVGELEKQVNLFMGPRIQHLENLQQRQMDIQSHLINSALNSGQFRALSAAPSEEMAVHDRKGGNLLARQPSSLQQHPFSSTAAHAPVFSQHSGNHVHRQKSPLRTPTPRRYAPVPVSKDAKMSQKMSGREQPIGEKENVHQSSCGGTAGGGKLLEQILNSQETPLSQTTSWKKPADKRVMPWYFERERPSVLQKEPFKSTNPYINPIEKTVKKADDVLHELGQLKREMHNILQDAKEWKSDTHNFIKTTSHLREAVRGKDRVVPEQAACSLQSSSEALHQVLPLTQQKDPIAPNLTELQQISKSSILQSTKASKSILRDAEKILRTVRKNKKLLEENLEAIIRAKDGNALHSFIDELTADRDVLEEIRIRKTVDEWIKAISKEIQDEMAKNDCLKTQQAIRTVKGSREMNAKSRSAPGIPAKKPFPVARPSQKLADKGPLRPRMGLQNEDTLSQVYGRPVYQGRRSTLKKSPYLRFNSPPPKSKPPRPKLIESVRGTKVKSAKTQTNPCPPGRATHPTRPCLGSASHQELHYLFSPTKERHTDSGPLEGHLIPMAIPLGQKQIDSVSPQPAGANIGEFHPVTVAASVPPLPKPQSRVKKPNAAVIEMKSEKRDPPKLTVQVLPNVDIDSISSCSTSVSQIPAPSLPAKTSSESRHLPDEELKLPGADLVDVIDVSQEEGGDGSDGAPDFPEPVLEFSRRGEAESPKYNGPPFPPAAPAPQVSADILDEIIEKRETLENKLVGWVEQEVMARIISGMYPAQKEAVPNASSSESEESQAVSSDIVEVAGTAGLQLFVDAGVPVDSEIIRRFVNEALAETVAVMLGDREDPRAAPAAVAPSTGPPLLEKETILSTPLVTPETTPPHSPPCLQEPLLVKTPESSGAETDGDAGSGAAAPNPMDTPVATPVATPPRVATPSPPVSEHLPDRGVLEGRIPPNAWGDTELPLEEEKPSPPNEEGGYHPRAVIMSVAQHEEPDSLVLPASLEPPRPQDSQPLEPRAPSPSVRTPSSGPSTEGSSPTVTETETETVDRAISEGEVLCSYGQVLAAGALAAEGFPFPNLNDSLTSTLFDAHEMDYDPPSEGQVLRQPWRGSHKDPVLSFFAKLNQAPLVPQEHIYQAENTDEGSAGELSQGQRPRLTKAAEGILLGRSLYVDQPASQASKPSALLVLSPGQCGRVSGEVLGEADVTHGPMSMAELDRPVSPSAYGDSGLVPHFDQLSQKLQLAALQAVPARSSVICVKPRSEGSLQPDQPAREEGDRPGSQVVRVGPHGQTVQITPNATTVDLQGDMDRTQVEPSVYLASLVSGRETPAQPQALPGPAKMAVKVPSASMEDQSFSSIHGSSDSSGADTF
ncbi:protein TALPID3 isoform X2 [Varanus komodoensis]|uniref:protein TALPID3 isoform X2 n=1 Tax=Varanus komodoensis TaxID=61221 RepID=UPI001CF77483|nr:protein TALPID3 isoform X2 [Varanus komodoensis]